jgi:hypothetical protein
MFEEGICNSQIIGACEIPRYFFHSDLMSVLRMLRGCLRTGCLGEYLDPRGMKCQVAGENSLYYSPHTIMVIKSRRVRWVGHVARIGKKNM